MLKNHLLLDSARTFSVDAPNIEIGRPGQSSLGDLKSCLEAPAAFDYDAYRWYVLRITYSREVKVSQQLRELGVKTFVPMMWKDVASNGKKQRKMVPAVNNLCFVYWSRKAIKEYMDFTEGNSAVRFYWDRASSQPMYVSDKAMEDFIKVASAIDEDIMYLDSVSEKFRAGQEVTITAGPFLGVTGKVVRVKKSRRVMVEIPGITAVVTAFVNPKDLVMKTE